MTRPREPPAAMSDHYCASHWIREEYNFDRGGDRHADYEAAQRGDRGALERIWDVPGDCGTDWEWVRSRGVGQGNHRDLLAKLESTDDLSWYDVIYGAACGREATGRL